ncbi:DNA-binding response regulator [Sphingobacteriaceae bacterium]|nr:DNA-binding response regulator [Sphingobacteriaceae bacterium]
METTPLRIIVADDHAVVRTGLQLILDETGDMEIVDEARDGDELLLKLEQTKYDLVLLDMSMPGKDALDVLKEIKLKWSTLPVIIFSMNPDELHSVRMIQNGASAYVNKQTHSDQLIEIIRTVSSGKKYIFPHQAHLLADQISAPSQSALPHTQLTDRESQVFVLLASGIRKSEIAEKLDISKNTISNHRNNIMKKMNMSLNSELTRYAIQHKIIQ